jgi:hypothetical protein
VSLRVADIDRGEHIPGRARDLFTRPRASGSTAFSTISASGRRAGRRPADPTGPQGAHVFVHGPEGVEKRGEGAVVQMLGEVLLDSSSVDQACGLKGFRAFGRHDDLDGAPVLGRALPLHETLLLHAVDDPRQAALARENSAREFVHADRAVRLLEIDEDVVPAQRHPGLRLQLGVEDVDQRVPAFEEDAPDRALLCRRA